MNIEQRVFLGGTCNGSTWREDLIPLLEMDYFNPVVKDWTPECQVEEVRQREICKFCVYVITPKMTGTYSIAEVVDDSNKRPERTIFCVLEKDGDSEFEPFQIKSLNQVKQLVKGNGGYVADSLDDVAKTINSYKRGFDVGAQFGKALINMLNGE